LEGSGVTSKGGKNLIKNTLHTTPLLHEKARDSKIVRETERKKRQ